jgi:calcineurin-like phosphoesterase family protein
VEREEVQRDPRGPLRLSPETASRHDAALLDAINSRVADDDVLWILGDFCWGKLAEATAYRNRIRCRSVHLVWGNHDHRSIGPAFAEAIEQGMIEVEGQAIWLNHYPMRSWDRAFHGSWHLYGHVHGRLMKADEADGGTLTRDVGVDACEYRPWSFDDLRIYMAPRIEKFHMRKAAMLEGRDEGITL